MQRHVAILAVLLSLGAGPLWAQDAPTPNKSPATQGAAKPQAVRSDVTPIDELKLRVIPLTLKELAKESAQWMTLVRAKAVAISEVEISSRKSRGSSKNALLESLSGMRDSRTALIDRTRVVLEAQKAKGGDVSADRSYLSVVSGVSVDLTDRKAVIAFAKGWLLSAQGGLRWAKNILFFLLTLFIFRILAWLAGRTTKAALGKSKNASELLKTFFVTSSRNVVRFVGFVIALSMLEVDIGPFLAAMGAAGFVIGFALQGTLSNFASGVMLLLYRPYDIGDMVTIAGTTGVVKDMSLVATTVTTGDNQIIVVPNGAIWGGIITNVTGAAQRRIDLCFGIGYDDNIAQAQEILEDIVGKHPLVLSEPAPVIRLHELADSSVNFVCRPWSKTGDYWSVYWDVTRQVKERFDAASISIPYPQQDLHIHSANAAAAPALADSAPVPSDPPPPPTPAAELSQG